MNFFFDIIEQFEISNLLNLIIFNPFYLFENLFIIIILIIISYFFIINNKKNFLFFFNYLIFYLIKQNLNNKFSNSYFNIVFVYFLYILFLFIFLQNIIGMIPDILTITSFIILPAHISFTFFIGSFLIVILQDKDNLIKGFLPNGVPVFIGPFLFIIEFISYFIRLFSLAIRLFINILAGHLLLKIFSTIVLLMFNFFYEIFVFQILINFITFCFIFLEYLACFLQAIVLVSLVSIYINHSLNFTTH
jgi:F-type H+-transporting ATPase subunit a